MTMVNETCEVCGRVSRFGAVTQHHLIPKSVTEEAEMPDSETVNLCRNCHNELHSWYKMKVADAVYDQKTKKFRAKSWEEMAGDYESAFNDFKKYKDEQKGSKFKMKNSKQVEMGEDEI